MGGDGNSLLRGDGMERIKTCIRTVFPECGEMPLQADTCLGQLAGWDSMTSINLLLELETVFDARLSLSGVFLHEKQTIADVAALLRQRGASVETDGAMNKSNTGQRRAS